MADAICSINGCWRSVRARGWCGMHYQRWSKYGSPHEKRKTLPKTIRRGSDHPGWKGDRVNYLGAHKRVVAVRGRASDHPCVDCGGPAMEWSLKDRAGRLVSDEGWPYSPDPGDYEPRCKKCHVRYDSTLGRRR